MKGRQKEAWHRVRSLGRREELDSGLDEEIRFHVDQQTEKNVRAGIPPDEARRLALIAFGGIGRARENARDEFRLALVEDLARDLRTERAPCCAPPGTRPSPS